MIYWSIFQIRLIISNGLGIENLINSLKELRILMIYVVTFFIIHLNFRITSRFQIQKQKQLVFMAEFFIKRLNDT